MGTQRHGVGLPLQGVWGSGFRAWGASQGAQYIASLESTARIMLRVLLQFKVYSLIKLYWALWVKTKIPASYPRSWGWGLESAERQLSARVLEGRV